MQVTGKLHDPVALPMEKDPPVPNVHLKSWMGEPQIRYGSGYEEKKSHHCPRGELKPSRLVTIQTDLPRIQPSDKEELYFMVSTECLFLVQRKTVFSILHH
jgi:hypothetical protein